MRDAHAINFQWLVTLRWGAIAGQAATILVADRLMGIALPVVPLWCVVAFATVTNVACESRVRRAHAVHESTIAGVMVVDVLLLTALLFLTGGPFNPFSCLYLVNIALAAVVLRPGWTWALVVLSLSCFGTLFADPGGLPLATREHAHHIQMHLQGMWVAFGVAAIFIVYFVQRVTRALADRDADLAAANARTARHERLASLATLAAGAAHELATPLSTIAVTAKELERALLRREHDATAAGDAHLIREQVERCRQILDHLTADAGETAGEAIVPVLVATIVDDALRGVDDDPRIRVVIEGAPEPRPLLAPPRAITQALRGVIDNARHAAPSDGSVLLRVRVDTNGCRFEVHDDGPGMPPDVLSRAGEPFFTTKPPGEGMGLGLFLARAVFERLGGALELSSALGRGTTTALVLPSHSGTEALVLPSHGGGASERSANGRYVAAMAPE